MKVHLPSSLRKALLSAIAVCSAITANAGIMHPGISIMTYTDFGQNMGRYVASGYENALLAYIRAQEGGVLIKYIDPSVPANTLPHDMMIDFSSQLDAGYAAAISYNFLATVQHNQNVKGTFSGNFIGGNYSIYYQSVDIVDSNKFKLSPSADYRVSRLTKLVTDVVGMPVYGQTDHDWSNMNLAGQQLYRAGSGSQWRGVPSSNRTTNKTSLCGAYAYNTGAVVKIDGAYYLNKATGSFAVITAYDDYTSPKGINAASPLTCMTWSGDSGSPVWVWNNKTGQYEYIAACQSGDNAHWAQYLGGPEWTVNTMESFNVTMDLGKASITLDAAGKPVVEVHIGAVNTSTGVTIRDSAGRSTTPWKGTITDGKGRVISEYIGMKEGHNTWKDLTDWRDKDNWYHYGYDKFDTSAAGFQDYLQTNDLVFVARTDSTTISMDADVDLGIGYVRLSKGKDLPVATFTVLGDHLLNSAGYVIDSGVELHLQLADSVSYTREWRAIVEEGGCLYIDGAGDTNALLNLGRKGTTYLSRENGYAAYNVLQSTGGTVVIKDTNQIKRDFTFGNQGGVLDMNGNSMTWNNSQGVEAEGFTIHALDEHAVIANRAADTTTTLTWTQTGNQTWLGSFQDTEDSALQFVYDGGGESVLTWRSIRTNLQNEDSGIIVDSGKLSLTGRNTVHAMGSATGRNGNRFSSANDWHYADATANVTVNDGGIFELASHARLTGNVTINEGGTFVMKEGVKNQMEYVEGGERLENTDLYKAFFGLKGNIVNNGTFMVNFSSGITCANEYAGNISGTGATVIDTGVDNGKFVFSGTDTTTGAHEVRSGYFILKGESAMGANTTGAGAWNIREKGVLAVEGVALPDIMPHIHAASNGALALMADVTSLDMSATPDLFIGVTQGRTIHFGEAGTAIQAWHTTDDNRTQWLFGGGGGNVSVDGLLTGDSDLVLGNAYTRGVVTLTNTGNSFTGNVIFNGPVTLDCTDVRALGNANIILGYGNRVSSQVSLSRLDTDSSGATMLLDGDSSTDLNLSGLQGVSISTAKDMTYTGNITVAEGAAYRFGVLQDATLTLATDLAAGHDLVVDAQTYSGGTVVIERAHALDGAVTVQGYDADLAHVSTGDTTLKLTVANALASASSVLIRNGGTIDIAGTDQTFNNVTIGAGGTITDSSNGATLTIDNAVVATFAGSMDVDTIVKRGSGALTLSGANYYDTMDVYGGILTVNNANGLAAGSITRMHNGTSITLNANVQSRIYLEGGNLTLGGSGNVSGDGAIIATGGKTSNVYLSGSTHAFAGEVGAEEGSTLRFQKPSATTTRTLALWATNINSAGGNIICDLKVNLDNGGTQTVGGTVTLAQATTWGIVTSYIGRTAGSVKNLDTVVVAGGTTQAYIYDQGVSGVWNIQHLNGGSNGSLQYTLRETSVNGANTLRFTGEGNYGGRVSYGATANSGYRNYYSVFFEIAHDKALQNAFLMPSAYNDSGNLDSTRTGQIRAAIAVNTDNARIRALGGAATAHVYAGAAAGSAKSAAPESTREATLTIGIGSGDSCTYSGSVSSNAATGKGINLVMDGLGNQAFNGTNVSLLSATGLRGVLKLNSNGVTIGRDMAVAQGGTIWWGANAASGDGTFSLDAGKSFSAIASPYEVASNVSANFNGSLSLNGGTLRYESGILLNADTAMSISGSISKGAAFGDTQYVDVVDAVSLEFGHEYHLSNGDWTAVSGGEFALTPFSPYADNYIDAAFTTSGDGLFATFSLAENAYLWNGTDEGHAWEGTSFFGSPANTPGVDDVAVFTNRAANTDVQIGQSINVGRLLFDSDNDYTLTVADGGSVTAGSLVMLRDAQATVNAGTDLGSVVVDKGRLALNGDTTVQQDVNLHEGTVATVNGAATIGGGLTLGNGVNALVRDGAAVTGAVSLGNGSALVLGGQSTAASLSLAADTALAGQGVGASLSVSGTLGLQGGGLIGINGINLTAVTGVKKSFATNSTSLVLSNNAVVDDRNSYYGLSNGGTLNFSGVETWEFVPDANGAVDEDGNPMGEHVLTGSTGGTYYINGLRLSDGESSKASTINVSGDVTLVITGSACGQEGSLAFSHWPTGSNSNRNANPANTINVYGTLTSNAALSAWDAPGLLQVFSGGTLNLIKGVSRNTDRYNDINVSVEDGARLNAAGGTQNDYLKLTLATGSTLGAIGGDVTFTNKLSMGTPNAAGAITFDTDAHTVGDNFALVQGTGGQMAFTGAVTSLNGTGLSIIGAGEATFTGALSIGADLQVKDTASFVSRGNQLSIRGDLAVAEGASATLDGVTMLSGLTLTEGSLNLSGAITLSTTGITNGGSISIADGTSFTLNYSDFVDDSYTLISGTGGISYANGTPVINVLGFDSNTIGQNQIAITADANELSISFAIPQLFWNATTGQVWNTVDNSWVNTKDKGAVFADMSRVNFDGRGAREVLISGDVTPLEMKIDNSTDTGYRFSSDNNGTLTVYTDLLSNSVPTTTFDVAVDVGRDLRLNGDHNFTSLTVGRDYVQEGDGSDTALSGNLAVTGNITMEGHDATLSVGGTTRATDITIGGLSRATFTGKVTAASITINGEGTQVDFNGHVSTTGKFTLGENAVAKIVYDPANYNDRENVIKFGSNAIQGRLVLEVDGSGWKPMNMYWNTTGHGVVVKDGTGTLQLWSTGNLNANSHTEIAAGTLVIQRGTTTGVIDVSGTGALLSQNSGVDSNTTNALNLFEGSELTFSSQHSSTWYINKLTGTGTLKLVQGDAQNDSNRIAHITGTGGFAGVIESDYSRTIVRVNNHGALNGAYINLQQGRLEMNSNNTLRGLDGGAATSLYNGNNTNTLTINTDAGGDYTFEGSITGTTASALALVVGGEGSQTFTQDGTFRSLTQTGGGLALGATTLVGAANLSGGTLHVAGDTSVGTDFAVSGTANSTIDGAVTVTGVFTASQNAVVNATGMATVPGVFTVTNEASVSLGGADFRSDVFVYASGQLAVSGDATIAGNFTMTENAVVSFTGANTTITGDVTVTGGTLDFAGKVSLETTINSAGNITFAAGTKLYLTTDDWTEGAPDYTIITGSGTITHSLKLREDIFINGKDFVAWRGENKRYTLINENGNLILSLNTNPQVLTWNGTSATDVWDTTKTNTNWQGEDEDPSAFTVKDTVVFAANPVQQEVTVAELGVYTGGMTVEGDGYSFSGGSVNVGGDMTLSGEEIAFNTSVAVDQDLIVTGSAGFNEDVAVSRNVIVRTTGDGVFNKELTVAGDVTLEGNGKMSMQKALELTGESRLVLGAGSEAVLGGLAGEETATITGADGSTLTLCTAEDAGHEFGGSIEADAIKVDGAGVQKLSGTVEASSVEVSGGTLEMKGTAIVETASATGAGKLAIAEGGALGVSGSDGYVTATRSAKATGESQATLRGVALGAAGVQGTNDNVEDCVLELTDLAWQGGSRTIGAVTIAGNSRIGDLPVANGISLFAASASTTVVFDGTVLELTSANAALNSYANYADLTLSNGSIVPGKAMLTSIRCNNVYADSLSGEVFLDASALQDRLTGDYVAFMFRYDGQDGCVNVDPDTLLYLVLDGYKPLQGCVDTFGSVAYFNKAALEKIETKPNNPNVPEPASTTLSLLALAALAARRRRK